MDALFSFMEDPWFYYLGGPLIVAIIGTYWFFFLREKPPAIPVKSTNSSGSLQGKPEQKKKPAKGNTQDIQDAVAKIKIFFGSQTGTAEDFSHRLAKEAKRYKFQTEVIDLEEYDPEELSSESYAIFCTATYGEGEPTDNAREFYEWLIDDSRGSSELSQLKYTVFGLGNTTYEQYNLIGKKFDQKLENMGGQRLFKLGLGDDDSSLEEDFAAWRKELWPALCKHFGIEGSTETDQNEPAEKRFTIQFYSAHSIEGMTAAEVAKHHLCKKQQNTSDNNNYDIKNPYLAKIIVNRELHTQQSDRSCRHIEIDLGNALSYDVGDHLGVYPENDIQIAEATAIRLGVDPNAVFALYNIQKDPSKPLLGPCTVRQALMQWCDLTNPPRKGLLHIFADYAQDPKEKSFLLALADEEKSQPYTKHIKDDHRSILQILNEFPSVKIPFDHFVEAVPRLAPRYYSISSSIKANPGRVHITSVVVEFHTPANRKHQGVCSTWLARQCPSEGCCPSVYVFVQKANFHLPKNPSTPVIMVGPGTGLAPFRGFIQERALLHKQGIPTENILFFGCRSSQVDFIYQNELDQAVKEGYLQLSVAFSREQAQKVYVQHKMLEFADSIWRLLNEKQALFYVCGDARVMAKDVNQSLHTIIMQKGGMSAEQADKYIADMQKNGRYLTDTWF